ncbi:hypothetical protein GJ744_008595 [Endocarpon pusillum]|uniref:Secreted protein n=1 Tax=Endocarpon pusillum TaxID=364733 RepID=A0A8H7E6Q3_9EURO|nr:hypothetical protein GJ744_008595 [Endocarpon pusillum]
MSSAIAIGVGVATAAFLGRAGLVASAATAAASTPSADLLQRRLRTHEPPRSRADTRTIGEDVEQRQDTEESSEADAAQSSGSRRQSLLGHQG